MLGPFQHTVLAPKSSLKEVGRGRSRLGSHSPVLMLEVCLALGQLWRGWDVVRKLGQLIQGLSQVGRDRGHMCPLSNYQCSLPNKPACSSGKPGLWIWVSPACRLFSKISKSYWERRAEFLDFLLSHLIFKDVTIANPQMYMQDLLGRLSPCPKVFPAWQSHLLKTVHSRWQIHFDPKFGLAL